MKIVQLLNYWHLSIDWSTNCELNVDAVVLSRNIISLIQYHFHVKMIIITIILTEIIPSAKSILSVTCAMRRIKTQTHTKKKWTTFAFLWIRNRQKCHVFSSNNQNFISDSDSDRKGMGTACMTHGLWYVLYHYITVSWQFQSIQILEWKKRENTFLDLCYVPNEFVHGIRKALMTADTLQTISFIDLVGYWWIINIGDNRKTIFIISKKNDKQHQRMVNFVCVLCENRIE